ncbi:hypothetical protein GHK86_11420 [Acidimicrobiaceae bacterium USS-CC1]|uniref:Fibronectin type-III domain-containing protein n=1 Tax=Acidiferrimicrobium australe TaxID=2664430 RepID=A0ABW9QV58_9ACTN|nr:hypothetical protein [Acidiferrimicrobium australe]
MDSKKRTLKRLGIAGVATAMTTLGAPALAGAATLAPHAATASTAPNAPTALTAKAGSNLSVHLTWSAPSGAKPLGYNVYVGSTSGGESASPANGNVLITGTSFTYTGATSPGPLYFTVAAVNAGGTSKASSEASATVNYILDSAPQSLTAKGGYQQAVLSWTPPTTGDTPNSYVVLDGTSAGSLNVVPSADVSMNSTSTSATVSGLGTSGTEYFAIEAVDNAGTSPASNTASATLGVTAPTAPTKVKASVNSSAEATVTWTKDATPGTIGDATSTPVTYYVYEGTKSGGETLVGSTTGSTYTTAPLANGTYYFYVKAATTAGGFSGPSSEVVTPVNAPTAPTGLKVTATGYSAADLSWTAPSGGAPSGYELLYSTTGAANSFTAVSSNKTFTMTSPTATTADVSGLAPSTKYYFEVETVGTPVNSVPSNVVSTTTTVTKPGTPMNLTGYYSSGKATLTFQPVLGSASDTYSVYVNGSTTAAKSTTTTASATPGYEQITVPNLATGFTYSMSVVASNPDGSSAAAGPISILAGQAKPNAPTGLTATDVTGSPSQVELTFNAPADQGNGPVTNYVVLDGSSPSALTVDSSAHANGVAAGTTSNSTDWIVPGLNTGQPYYFEVEAVNAAGNSPASAAAQATPMSTPTAAPTLSASATNGEVDLSWTAVSSITANDGGSPIIGYNVYENGSKTPVNSSPISGTSYAVTGLTNSTAYTFTVAAVNAQGAGIQSSPALSATPKVGKPDAPTGVNATANGSVIDLSWKAPANNGGSAITGYKVLEATVTGGVPGTYAEVDGGSPVTGMSAVIDGLTTGTTYSFEVQAVNANGTGPASSAASATAGSAASAPSQPGTPTATALSGGRALVAWGAPSSDGGEPVLGYFVTAHLVGGKGKTVFVTGTNATVSGLMTGTYYFTVVAKNSVGNGTPSSPSSFVKVTAPAPVKVYVTPPKMIAKAGVTVIRVTTSRPGVQVHLFDEAFGTSHYFQKKIMTTTAQSNGTGVAIFKIGIARANKFFVVADGVKSNTVIARVK